MVTGVATRQNVLTMFGCCLDTQTRVNVPQAEMETTGCELADGVGQTPE